MWICKFGEQISIKDNFWFASSANKPQGFNVQIKKESCFAFTKHGHMEPTFGVYFAFLGVSRTLLTHLEKLQ